MNKRKFDFNRIALLFHVGEKARGHGTAYANIVAAVDAELRAINAGVDVYEPEQPRVVTPPAGPASSMIQNPDGTRERINDPQLGLSDRPKNLDPGYDPNADLRGVQQPMPQDAERVTPPEPVERKI